MAAPSLDYTALVQQALRGVVREVLRRVAEEGLPADHHFFITFRTQAVGVVLPARQRMLFPDEMTIVLQHQFWGLAADDEKFVVTLRFSGQPVQLEVPFAAITAFADPAADFGLRFEAPAVPAAVEDRPAGEAHPADARPEPSAGTGRASRPARPVSALEPVAAPAPQEAPASAPTARLAPARRPKGKVVELAAFRRSDDAGTRGGDQA